MKRLAACLFLALSPAVAQTASGGLGITTAQLPQALGAAAARLERRVAVRLTKCDDKGFEVAVCMFDVGGANAVVPTLADRQTARDLSLVANPSRYDLRRLPDAIVTVAEMLEPNGGAAQVAAIGRDLVRPVTEGGATRAEMRVGATRIVLTHLAGAVVSVDFSRPR